MYQQVFKLHADLLKALANSRRLEIIHLLRNDSLKVAEMQNMLGLPQANLSQHLMVLRDFGVVKFEKIGKEVFYKLASKNFVKASDMLREVLIEKHKGDSLADELTIKMKDLVPIVTDPVCKMRVSPKTAARGYTHKDTTYYFCGSGCYKEFKKNVKNYVDPESSSG